MQLSLLLVLIEDEDDGLCHLALERALLLEEVQDEHLAVLE
jgi:hypothetical protein